MPTVEHVNVIPVPDEDDVLITDDTDLAALHVQAKAGWADRYPLARDLKPVPVDSCPLARDLRETDEG